MAPRKRKAKSKSAGPEPTPDAVDSQAPRDPVDQGAPDLPLQELLAEGQAQPAEQQEGQDLVDSGGLAEAKKKKMLTALTPEQEEDMVEWLSEHPVLWNKKMKDYKDIQMKDVLWRDQAAKLDKDVSEIQLWYKSLRSRFGRLKKLPSGSGALECSERDKWILLRLEFLRPFIADVPKRTAVSFRTKMGCQQQGALQPYQDENDPPNEEREQPADQARSSEMPFETVTSPSGSINSARPEARPEKKRREEQEREIFKLQRQLLDHFKKPQPTEERDCFADWLRSVFHSFDTALFRRCQREISGMVFKYQEMNESQTQTSTASVPAPSSQALRPPMEQSNNQQPGTSQPQQLCSMQWQPNPSSWPTNVQNPQVSVWGSQDVQWVQQQQLQQQVRQAPTPSPVLTFSNPTQQGSSQEYDGGASLNMCTFVVERDQQQHAGLTVPQEQRPSQQQSGQDITENTQ